MNPDQQIELYRAARSIAWSYRLQDYNAAALKDLQRIVDKSKGSIIDRFENQLGAIQREGSYTRKHFQNSLKELERLSLGLRNQLGEQLTTSTSRIGSLALKEWGENLSVGGVAKMVNTVALSPEQFAAFFKRNPPAGILIPKVMRNALNQGVIGRIEGELLDVLREGALTGQSYKRIVDKLEESFTDFNRHQLTTLTRTFFQTANAQAFDAVYQANQDIMEGKIWTNVNDDRVCLLCLPLGEVLYKKGDPHPPMPRHPNCRCVFRAKTVSYRSLGIDVDELEEVAAPVVTRGYEKNGKWIIPPAGTGTGRRPRAVSFYQGGMKEAFPDLPEAQQKAILGVGRYNKYKAGELTLDQLADPVSGKLWLLKELDEGMHLQVPDVPKPAPIPPINIPFDVNSVVWKESSDLKEIKTQFLSAFEINIRGGSAKDKELLYYLNQTGKTLSEEIYGKFPDLRLRAGSVLTKSKIKGFFFDKTPFPKGSESLPSALANYWGDKKHIHIGTNSLLPKWSPKVPHLHLGVDSHNISLDYASIFRHEYGHHVHQSILKPALKKKWNAFYANNPDNFSAHVSRYSVTNEMEAFAETFAAITSPKYDWKGMYASKFRLPKDIEDMMISIIGKPKF